MAHKKLNPLNYTDPTVSSDKKDYTHPLTKEARKLFVYRRHIHNPRLVTNHFIQKTTELFINKLLQYRVPYLLYISLSDNQRRALKRLMCSIMRKHLFHEQQTFFESLALTLLTPQGQLKSDFMNNPMYHWTLEHVYGGRHAAMLYSLQTLRRNLPSDQTQAV